MRAAAVEDDILPDDHRVAGEAIGLALFHGNQFGHGIFESLQPVPIERAGVVERLPRTERTEAGIEVIEMIVDQLQRDHPAANACADPLQGPRIAADEVAAEQRVAAEERIARAFEVHGFGGHDGPEPAAAKPGFVDGGFPLTGRVAERGDKRGRAPDQAGVRGEDEVGQALHGRHQPDIDPQRHENIVQRLPLRVGQRAITPLGLVHPGIDLVLDPVVVGRAHENRGTAELGHRNLPSRA